MRKLTVMIRGRVTVTMPGSFDPVDPADWLRTAGNGLADLIPRALETCQPQMMEKVWAPAKGIEIEVNLTTTAPI